MFIVKDKYGDDVKCPAFHYRYMANKGKRKVQVVPESQTAALPRHQKEEETDKSKQAHFILNVPVLSSSWDLGKAAVCDCGTLWTFLLTFFIH